MSALGLTIRITHIAGPGSAAGGAQSIRYVQSA